jgi:hypothetical protein
MCCLGKYDHAVFRDLRIFWHWTVAIPWQTCCTEEITTVVVKVEFLERQVDKIELWWTFDTFSELPFHRTDCFGDLQFWGVHAFPRSRQSRFLALLIPTVRCFLVCHGNDEVSSGRPLPKLSLWKGDRWDRDQRVPTDCMWTTCGVDSHDSNAMSTAFGWD